MQSIVTQLTIKLKSMVTIIQYDHTENKLCIKDTLSSEPLYLFRILIELFNLLE